MPHVLTLKDGKLLTPFEIEDAFEAVEEYAGYDLREFIEEYISEQLEDYKDYEEDFKALEMFNEEQTANFNKVLDDIQDGLEALYELLAAERLNRVKLRKAVNDISDIVHYA